jgi:DNA repair protein RadC
MAINYWPAGERPREKLIGADASSLSGAELPAIFLRSGLRGEDAVNLARTLLKPLMARNPCFTAVSGNSARCPVAGQRHMRACGRPLNSDTATGSPTRSMARE